CRIVTRIREAEVPRIQATALRWLCIDSVQRYPHDVDPVVADDPSVRCHQVLQRRAGDVGRRREVRAAKWIHIFGVAEEIARDEIVAGGWIFIYTEGKITSRFFCVLRQYNTIAHPFGRGAA